MTRLGAERPRQAAEERCLSRPVSSGEENRFPALEPGGDASPPVKAAACRRTPKRRSAA
jgi:hypothetical protein